MPDASFDCVVMGYALRHVADLLTAFREMRRVLRPGGRVLILEITPPEGRIARALLKVYLKGVVPPAMDRACMTSTLGFMMNSPGLLTCPIT